MPNKTGIAAVMGFMGRRTGQSLAEFKAEYDQLSRSEKDWFISECERELNQ